MPSLSDLKPGDPTTTLLKGPTGFGKTIAAASYPAPVYIFDWDARVNSIQSFYKGERNKEIYFDNYGAHNLFEYLDKLNELVEKGTIRVDNKTIRPSTVVVADSVTALSIGAVDYQLDNVKKIAKTDRKVGKKTQGGIIIPDWDEYKGETSVFTEVLGNTKALPGRWGMHAIMTAHPIKSTAVGKDSQGKVSVSIKTSPIVSIGMKAGELVPTAFNEVYHFALLPSMNAGERGKRLVYTEATGDESAKTTMLLPIMFEWTNELFYDKLVELAKRGIELNGNWKEEKDMNKSTVDNSGW
jgi:hypothetical protein